jgi:general secretion pathway protein D
MRSRTWLLITVLVGVVALPVGAQQPGTVRINYVDADLRDVIRSLAAVLGVNVILTDVPSKRITLQTPEPVVASQAGAVLESVLESQGLVLVQTGPVAQVLPEAKRPSTGPVSMGKQLPTPPPLGIITQIVPLEFIRADEAVTLLTQTAGKAARIEVVPRSNAVLITDRGVNVARYLDLLRQLDVKTGGESGLRTYVYPLKHASAVELASTLGQVFGTGGGGGGAPERVRVQALENRSLSSDLESFRRRELESLEQRRQNPIPTMAAPAPTGAPPPAPAESAGTPGSGLVGQTTIIPDQATNSLVIRTAPPNFPVLQETIDQLDIRPAQVLLEVLIAEVELDRATQYGVNWQLFTQELVSGDSTRGITAGYGPQVFSDSALSGAGFGLRVVSMANVSVRAIVKALSSRVKVRVLSTPRILALNNEEARILVGSEVPFNQSTRTGLDVIVDQTVQFRKVGTQLTVIPTVNKDGYVTFRVLQEASALTSQTIPSALNAPVITTREAETSAIVKDGNTVIIGGLIGETHQVTQSGVPILQDLPLLGGLFRTKGNSRQRTELAIFMTPHVVMNDQQADPLLRHQRDKFQGAKSAIDSILPAVESLPPPVQRKP